MQMWRVRSFGTLGVPSFAMVRRRRAQLPPVRRDAAGDHARIGRHAVREYLDAFDAGNPASDDDDVDSPETRKSVSLCDPSASWTTVPDGPTFYG